MHLYQYSLMTPSLLRMAAITATATKMNTVDIIDGTPILDIKPYVSDFDMRETDQIGWLAGRSRNVWYTKSDGRLKQS